MPWLWAPIKVILKVASDYIEAFDKIIKAYSRIAEPLARFKLLGQTFSKHPHVQDTLAVFYSDILRFHKDAYKFVCRSGWEILFLSSWGRFQRRFDSIFDDLQRHEELIDKTAAAVNIVEAKAMRDDLEIWRQESLEKLEKEEGEKTSSQYLTIVGWLKLDESDQLKIFDSISSEALGYPGTTDWITKNSMISSWMRPSHETSFLVLHGLPGTGKSVLASHIATFLRSADASLVITHFCSYSYAASTEYEQVLRSMLAQLIRCHTDLVAHAYDELIVRKKPPTAQTLEKLIRDLIVSAALSPSETRCIHIILDGLNECHDAQQTKVVKALEQIVAAVSSSSSTICKVLLCTRLEATQSVQRRLRQKPMIYLSDEKRVVTQAIRQYSSRRVEKLSERLRQTGMTESDNRDLVTQIANKADGEYLLRLALQPGYLISYLLTLSGMFLWARLVLDYLSKNIFFSRAEILSAADALPRELSEL